MSPDDVLDFWFAGCGVDPDAVAARHEVWYRGGPEVDAAIAARFGEAVERAAAGALDAWADDPRGRLALLVLLDQFSRNTGRGTAAAFANDARALRLCLDGIESGADAALNPVERSVFYLPLQHAEDRAAQARSVERYEALAADPPPGLEGRFAESLRFAREHRDVVERFGRFPHRNAALGRETTPAEAEYLADGAPRYGQ